MVSVFFSIVYKWKWIPCLVVPLFPIHHRAFGQDKSSFNVWSPSAKIYIYQEDGTTRIVGSPGQISPDSILATIQNLPSLFGNGELSSDSVEAPNPLAKPCKLKKEDENASLLFDSTSLISSFILGGEQGAQPTRGGFKIPLAIETDYELYNLAGGSEEAVIYFVTKLISQVNLAFQRDVDASFYLTYLGIYKRPDPYDVFYSFDPLDKEQDVREPMLAQFSQLWEDPVSGKAEIPRALAHLITGKVAGTGIAATGRLCNAGYGFSGVQEAFIDVAGEPGMKSYVPSHVMTVTHELGHSVGSPHTFCGYRPEVDRSSLPCSNDSWPKGEKEDPPQIPTIMSYHANRHFVFHPRNIETMQKHLNHASCIYFSEGGNQTPQIRELAIVPTTTQVGQMVSFGVKAKDAEDQTLVYEWNLGDGTHQVGPVVTHRFETPGIKWVAVTVRNMNRGIQTAVRQVKVEK